MINRHIARADFCIQILLADIDSSISGPESQGGLYAYVLLSVFVFCHGLFVGSSDDRGEYCDDFDRFRVPTCQGCLAADFFNSWGENVW